MFGSKSDTNTAVGIPVPISPLKSIRKNPEKQKNNYRTIEGDIPKKINNSKYKYIDNNAEYIN